MGTENMENKEFDSNKKKEEIKEFSEYLGVDYQDFYEMTYKSTPIEDIDFDDYSR